MAKPNYSFEKRQRELAKKKKKEEKLQEKAARKSAGVSGADTGALPDDAALPGEQQGAGDKTAG